MRRNTTSATVVGLVVRERNRTFRMWVKDYIQDSMKKIKGSMTNLSQKPARHPTSSIPTWLEVTILSEDVVEDSPSGSYFPWKKIQTLVTSIHLLTMTLGNAPASTSRGRKAFKVDKALNKAMIAEWKHPDFPLKIAVVSSTPLDRQTDRYVPETGIHLCKSPMFCDLCNVGGNKVFKIQRYVDK